MADFIELHLHHLPPNERDNAHTYNSAMLCYYRKQYRQAVKLLQTVEFTDLYYQLDARSILLKVYFENLRIRIVATPYLGIQDLPAPQ